jgi:hypothetical protein
MICSQMIWISWSEARQVRETFDGRCPSRFAPTQLAGRICRNSARRLLNLGVRSSSDSSGIVAEMAEMYWESGSSAQGQISEVNL